MSTPNLPLRYEIENDGTGGAAELEHICTSIMSEGGTQEIGMLRHISNNNVSGLTSANVYGVQGIRLKSTHLGATILFESISAACTTNNDQARWGLVLNPTINGSPSWVNQGDGSIQVYNGSSSHTITGGDYLDGGFLNTTLAASKTAVNALHLGASILGVRDEIVLAIAPITSSLTISTALTWRDLA
jgi:hypothetical protein